MNKASKLFSALAAVALMSACSSEEPANNGGENGGLEDGQKAYLTISIKSAGDMGRSTDYDTPTYVDGDEAEHTVTSARFFLFDGEGNYVLKASITDPEFQEDNPNDENIEYFSKKNILVIDGVKQQGYPEYMLTVLNVGDDFTPESTLQATTEKLSKYADNFTRENSKYTKANFVMSTSGYLGGTSVNHNDTYYNVTKLVADNFRLTTEDALNNNPVDVYVERLAAKVQVEVNAPVEEINGEKYFVLSQTIAGGDNNQNNDIQFTDSKIYLKVVGWGLNATANQAYVGKQLDAAWSATGNNPFANWTNAGLFRSFWAKSFIMVDGANDANLSYTNILNLTSKAGSTTLGDQKMASDAEYCYENTNLADNIFATNNANQTLVDNSKVTHVVLYTQTYNAKGEVQPIVEYQGTPFLEDTFKSYVLNSLKNSVKGLNYYYLDATSTEETKNYTQVQESDITFEGIAGKVGEVNLVLVDPAKDLYKKEVNAEVETYTKLEGADNDLATRLTSFQGTTPLYWHNKGTNMYYIPIEHNAPASVTNKKIEGYYGVVRNHWYVLKVNKFSKLGHAVYDPDNGSETLKPDKPEDPLYYVGARINILSWRVINQNVEL